MMSNERMSGGVANVCPNLPILCLWCQRYPSPRTPELAALGERLGSKDSDGADTVLGLLGASIPEGAGGESRDSLELKFNARPILEQVVLRAAVEGPIGLGKPQPKGWEGVIERKVPKDREYPASWRAEDCKSGSRGTGEQRRTEEGIQPPS